MMETRPAPAWRTSAWFNTDEPLSLDALRGRVIVLHTFQMLCPGCAIHALPQAQRVHDYFDARDVAVVGLHTVFEHHDVMRSEALSAFLYEYRYSFPVGVDQSRPGEFTPYTMAAYGLRGTPSLVLIDRAGQLQEQHFGRVDDLALGARITRLVTKGAVESAEGQGPTTTHSGNCGDGACAT